MQLLDMERLEALRDTDQAFVQAKYTAAAFNDPARIWEGHDGFRRELVHETARPDRPTPTFDDVVRIHRRMQAAGLLPPDTGVVN